MVIEVTHASLPTRPASLRHVVINLSTRRQADDWTGSRAAGWFSLVALYPRILNRFSLKPRLFSKATEMMSRVFDYRPPPIHRLANILQPLPAVPRMMGDGSTGDELGILVVLR
ncbi:hypothetical protein E2C01_082437 [Portunus trituberculatus]|uniref:Uncharacterized protein n=1 Tax=Portunus trituberculatus TaxID=210409 RepID=A0A5B7IPX9_PORTR|nr:hypothetical protein [Portunus trituberculatus]